MVGARRTRASLAIGSLALGLLSLAAACTSAGPTSPSAPSQSSPATVTLSARDLAFVPNQLSLKAGVPMTLVLKNEGSIEHDVVVEGLNSAPATASSHGHSEPSHSMGVLPPGTVHVSAHGGEHATVELTPKPGTFEFYCSVPGHRAAGMRGVIEVK